MDNEKKLEKGIAMKKLLKNGVPFIFPVLIFGASFYYLKFQESDYDSIISTAYKKKDQFSEFVKIDDAFEPDAPDKEINSKDHLGVDADNNGIRDDIDIWINRMGRSLNERMAMRQYAKTQQVIQKNCHENNFDKNSKELENLNRARECLRIMSNYERKEENYGIERLNILTSNTDLRKACYKFDENQKNEMLVSLEALRINCNFEVHNPKIIVEVYEILRKSHN